MEINVIRGSIGSGKGDKCTEMIANIHKLNPKSRCIMLVPNHNSYETEKRFVEKFGGTGLNNIEVMTLRRLAMNLLNNNELNYITDSGRQMLIRKAIIKYCTQYENEQDKRLLASIKKPGFAEVMASLISEFKRYIVTPDELLEKSGEVDDGLKNKMRAAAGIYKIYSGYIEESDYTDSEDDNTRLAEHILTGGYFNSDTYIWVDKFNEFTPQQLNVLRAAASAGARLTVTVSYPSEKMRIYEAMKNTMRHIDDLTDEFGMGEIIDTGSGFKNKKSDEVKFLLKNWGRTDAVWEKETEDIVYFSARDIYNEVETIACKIVDLVREEGMRYRDIAILCGNTDEYNHIIKTVFTEYKVPYFTDSTVTLSDHPIAMQILSVFDMFDKDWTYEDVFRYLKSGFIYSEKSGRIKPLDVKKIDFLENYVLKYGIRGKKAWISEWTRGDSILDAAFDRKASEDKNKAFYEGINEFRLEIVTPLDALYEKVKKANTAAHFARALFEFLREIKVDKGLKYEISKMQKNGEVDEAERFTKLWNLLLDVLNQTTVALGDEKITFSEFGDFIRAGLDASSIRTIPSGIDQVYVGSVEKSSACEVRAMFIAGANDGTFPNGIPNEGFFSDFDRNVLSEKCGINIAPDTNKKFEKQYFKVYAALCSVSEKLFLSRPLQDGEGKALAKSILITDIETIFKKLRNATKDELENGRLYISTPEATIHRMLIKKSVNNTSAYNPIWDAVYEWYKDREEWKNKVSLIGRTSHYRYSDIKLDSELAQKLYGEKVIYSSSRLNTFAECPFGYFLKYGLHLKEREIWDITPADVGSYAHEVIRIFCEAVENGAETPADKINAWRTLTDERRRELLDKIVDEACENMLKNNSRDKEKNASVLKRTGRNIQNAALTVHRALASGSYSQIGMEQKFSMPVDEDIEIHGIIDRVDMYSDKKEAKVRIIDYKTGRTEFDVVNIANGIDMQMVIYAIAARNFASQTSGKKARITGIYYNKVHDKSVTVDMGGGEEAAKKKSENEFKLDGITFMVTDEDLYENDRALMSGDTSEFLNIAFKKDGGIKSSSAVRTGDEIEGLTERVKENIINIDKGIKEGNISCAPYRSDKGSSCDYCSMAEICVFTNNKEPREKTGNAKDVWEEMGSIGRKKSETEDKNNGGKLD